MAYRGWANRPTFLTWKVITKGGDASLAWSGDAEIEAEARHYATIGNLEALRHVVKGALIGAESGGTPTSSLIDCALTLVDWGEIRDALRCGPPKVSSKAARSRK